MTIYYVILATILGLYLYLYLLFYAINNKLSTDVGSRYVKHISQKKVYRCSKFYFIIVSIFMIIVIGFRHPTIGIDTMNYYITYYRYAHLPWEIIDIMGAKEQGYVFLQILFNELGLGFQMFLIAMAVFYIGLVTFIIYKHSKLPWLSYFIFISFGYLTFSMSAIRQTIAMSIIMVAFILMQKRKLIPFLITVFVAATMHISAIVFLPAYILNKFKPNKKNILIIAIFGFLVFIFKEPIRVWLNMFARIPFPAVETGGDLMYLFFLGTVLIGLFFGKALDEKNKENLPFFYMLVAATIIFPVLQFHPAVLRLHFYFSIFMIIYIPNMLSSITDKPIKAIGYISYICIGIYFMLTQVFIAPKQLMPYLFFWQ